MPSIVVDEETFQLLDECKKDYLKNHKEFEKIPISKNKIIYVIARFYLK
jgi:hypothetical protein